MIVVADTTPLNYLILINEVDVLPKLYGRVVIPPAVQEELTHSRAPANVTAWIAQPPSWLEVLSPAQVADAGLAGAVTVLWSAPITPCDTPWLFK